MPELVPFPVDRSDVTPYFEALAATLDGKGPALMPYEADAEAPAQPTENELSTAPENLALVVSTSGSTGKPKRAMLTRDALIASAQATYERFGGAGTWLLPMPPHHIAGTQVLVRSIVAGTTPIVMPKWDVDAFTKATALVARNAPPFSPIYTSMVPTQLRDVLANPNATAAARRYGAVLTGGAATPASLRQSADEAGLKIIAGYGSSETAGGCIYDGIPMNGVHIHLLDRHADGVGRVAITGPTLASGYLGDPERTAASFIDIDDQPAYRTDDLGTVSTDENGNEHLTITGRVDDVINTGGYKVSPHVVEEALRGTPGVTDAIVVGRPDERWGQAVSAAIQPQPGIPEDELTRAILSQCRQALPAYAVPRFVSFTDALPMRGIGKPDRGAVASLQTWHLLH